MGAGLEGNETVRPSKDNFVELNITCQALQSLYLVSQTLPGQTTKNKNKRPTPRGILTGVLDHVLP